MIVNSNPIYIVLHIHKCAGITVATHIADHMSPEEYIGFYTMQNPYFENRTVVNAYVDSLSSARVNKLRVITGHGAYWGIHKRLSRPCRYVVFLRKPLARAISNYAYFFRDAAAGVRKHTNILDKHGKPYSFETWFTRQTIMHNYMTRYLYHALFYRRITGEITDQDRDKVQAVLRSFYLVGLVEQPVDYWFLFHCLGIPLSLPIYHVTDRKFYPGRIDSASVVKYLKQDMTLYRHFLLNPQPVKNSRTLVQLYAMALKDRLMTYI